MPRHHRSALTSHVRTLPRLAIALCLTVAACNDAPTRPSDGRSPAFMPEPRTEPRTIRPIAGGSPTISVYSGAEADSLLAARAAELASRSDARSIAQLLELREHMRRPVEPSSIGRPSPSGITRILDPAPDEGSTTTDPPPPFARILDGPKLGLLLREDFATATATATIQGTHLHGDMTLSAKSQIEGGDISETRISDDALNPAVSDCLNYRRSCDLIGVAQLVAEIRGLYPCGMTVNFGGVFRAYVSSFGLAVTLYQSLSWSQTYVSIGTNILASPITRESDRCTPPNVQIRLQGTTAVYNGGTLVDSVPAGSPYQVILDGTKTTSGTAPNTSFEWFADGVRISDLVAAVHSPSIGSHIYEFRVRNSVGLEARASAKLILVAKTDSIIKRESDSGGGGDGTDDGGTSEPEICYDWYDWYYETGEIVWIGESCGNEPPPSGVYATSRAPSAGGALSFSVNGTGAASRSVTLVLTDALPAGNSPALYSPPGAGGVQYLLIPVTATASDVAAAIELARRSLTYPIRPNTLVGMKRFAASDRWLDRKRPAADQILSELRSAPVKRLVGLGERRTLTVSIEP